MAQLRRGQPFATKGRQSPQLSMALIMIPPLQTLLRTAVAIVLVAAPAPAQGHRPVASMERVAEQTPADPLVGRIRALLDSAGIPGASVAKLEAGRIAWASGFGVRQAGGTDPVDTLTVFEGASLTKPIVAAGLLRMVGRGEFDLDRSLSEYLPYPDIEDDPRYRRITARIVLSHTTGFPNWRGDRPLRINFEPGSRFGYSGEGFVYLQRVIEHVTGEPLAEWARREVLVPVGMSRSSLKWEARFEANLALPHDRLGKPGAKGRPNQANAAWSLQTTAVDVARFLLALREGPLLRAEERRAMFTPQVNVTEGVSWGLGIGLQGAGDSLAIWHWGDNTGYKDFAILFVYSGEGLVYLSNSDQGMSVVDAILVDAFGGEQAAVRYLDYERHDAPRRLVRLALDSAINAGGPGRGIARYRELKAQYPPTAFDVELLQDIARIVMRAGFADDAVQLLELNVSEYPTEWTAHASLADAYARLDRTAEAVASYERALALDPNQPEIRAKLDELIARR